MLPGKQDFEHYRGDTFGATVELHEKTPEGEEGPVLDLTDAEVNAQLRVDEDTPDPDFIAFVATIQDPPTLGRVRLALAKATTTQMSGTYKWDLQVTWPSGEDKTYLAGTFTITKDVTRV